MPSGRRLLEADLRAIAREHIKTGRLPASFPPTVCAYYSSGMLCQLCGQQIQRGEVGYEVSDIRIGATFTLHISCHTCWKLECVSLATNDLALAARS
jgi:hypothetical protein